MASSFRQFVHRVRRKMGWITDDRELERRADADQAKQKLYDTVSPVDKESPMSTTTNPPSQPTSDPDHTDPPSH